ncbi:MAG: hypothetical protein K9N23_19310 [Akkermansiaceae bacterium]|nr:hypothetical protein [Akkermansiaceae bacterium]
MIKRMKPGGYPGKVALLGLIFLLVKIPSLRAGENILSHTDPDGAGIAVEAAFEPHGRWSFVPLEVTLKQAGGKAAEWQLMMEAPGYGRGSFRSGVGLLAKTRQTRASILLVGGTTTYYGSSSNPFYLSAKRAGGGSVRNSFGGSGGRNGGTDPLVSTGLSLSSGGTAFDCTLAPSDWRAYAGYSGLVVKESEWNGMAPAARSAIRQWVRLGGRLVVADATPGSFSGLPVPDSASTGGMVSRGGVKMLTQEGGDTFSSALDQLEQQRDSNWFHSAIEGNTLNEWEVRAPGLFAAGMGQGVIVLMILVVLAFAVLVGPVNLFLLAPARRRHRLFFTTPLISLGAGVLLVVAVLLSDGLGGKGRRHVWLESVPAENTAYLVQHQHSRCGAMFSTGFEIPEAAYFAPLSMDHLSGSFEVSLEADKVRAEGPWFSSRQEQGFLLAVARPGRGRLELGGTTERPTLTSAFDFPLASCYWLAPDGESWWKCGELGQGTAVALAPATQQEMAAAVAEFTGAAPAEYEPALETATRRPGYFVALAPRVAAIETHRSIKWDTRGIVTGPVATP